MSPRESQGSIDEETPLLHAGNAPQKATPLPATQISILLLLLLAEPITSLSINPYINQVCFVCPALCKIFFANVVVRLLACQRTFGRWR
jgi:hypothetical protein